MSTTVTDKHELLNRTEEVEQNLAAVKPGMVVDLDVERRQELCRKIEDAVLDLCNVLPKGTADFEGRQLLILMVELRRAINDDPEVTDGEGRVELARLKMLDIVKRMERRIQHYLLDDPAEAVSFVLETLSPLSQADLGELLGVSSKTVSAWANGGPIKNKINRVTAVAQIVSYLESSMTPRGILLWFQSPQDRFNGVTPIALLTRGLDEPNEELVSAVRAFARGGRGQLGD